MESKQILSECSMVSPNMDWTVTALLVPHEPIRRMMAEMVKIVFSSLEVTAKFHNWYTKYFYKIIHEHHDVEEHIYFPALESKAGKLPPKLSDDHVTLIRKLDEVRDLAKQAAGPGEEQGKDARDRLHTVVVDMVESMRAHLKEEEETVPAILKAHFTKEEHAKIVKKIGKSGGFTMAKLFLPAIYDAIETSGGYGSLNKAELRKEIPGPLNFLNDVWFRKNYDKKNKKVLMALAA